MPEVAAISAGDEAVGEMVADAMEKVSNDGVITIEESKTMKTELDLVEGMQFDRGYVIRIYVQQIWKRWKPIWTIHISLSPIKRFSNIQEILPILEQIVQTGAKLIDHC